MPAPFRGTWAVDADACADPQSDGRVRVTERAIEFFAARCRIRTLAAPGRSIRAGVVCREEEGTGRRRLRLRFAGEGALRIRDGHEFDLTYIRCVAPDPAR